jgi:hypothetical protein
MPTHVHEEEMPTLGQVFMLFLSKFEMPIYMEVVSFNKMDNFPKGRILSV